MAKLIRETWGAPFSMRKAYGEALIELGKTHPNVVVLSADVSNSDHSGMFEAMYPERFFNVGIAEPALVDVAVGFANSGYVPIANTFSFLFATRALEQIRTHLCYGQQNVKLAGAYSGLSDSFDGPTHQSIADIATLRALPNMTIVVPADPLAVKKLLPKIVEWRGPVFFRLCRNEVSPIFSDAYEPEIGKGLTLCEGTDVTIICCGVMVERSLLATQQLAAQNIHARVIELHTVKPLDAELVLQSARETEAIVTVEEHSIIGGLGGAVAEILAECSPVPLERVGIADTFAESGPYQELMDKYGLSVAAIQDAARRAIARKRK